MGTVNWLHDLQGEVMLKWWDRTQRSLLDWITRQLNPLGAYVLEEVDTLGYIKASSSNGTELKIHCDVWGLRSAGNPVHPVMQRVYRVHSTLTHSDDEIYQRVTDSLVLFLTGDDLNIPPEVIMERAAEQYLDELNILLSGASQT